MPSSGASMETADLTALVAQGESEMLEFKGSTSQLVAGCQTLCGMLNARGGQVLFGVNDKGTLVGQTVSEATLREISQAVRRIDPHVDAAISTVEVGSGKSVIVVTCQASTQAPHAYDGRHWQRVGSTTVPMPQVLVEDRMQERMHGRVRWELHPAPERFTLEDLDANTIRTCIRLAVQRGRLDEGSASDIPAVLRGFDLMRGDRLLNGAIIAFGREHCWGDYPQILMRMARFRGKDRLADFEDNRQVYGNIFTLLEAGERFLRDHNPIASKVEGDNWIRTDRPRYAPRAFREALANALIHRDYAMHGGSIALAIYDDHLEITNPGRFHFGLTPADLGHTHESRRWNPNIANVFYRAGIIEQWGTGSINILRWCQENASPAPTWTQMELMTVCVTFQPAGDITPEVTGQVTGQVTEQVTEQVAALLEVCTRPMTRGELQAAVGLTHRNHFTEAYLKPALTAGLIEMTRPDAPRSRLQRYRLTAAGVVRKSQAQTKGSRL
ncbi:ATP-dependent DNA helicase [Planctomycetota bacterium]|nr:ATP-dependent DNA helicase [Planctomycetota bacterium]